MQKIKLDPRDVIFYMGHEPPIDIEKANIELKKKLTSKDWIDQCNKSVQDSCLSELNELIDRYGLNTVEQCLEDMIK